MAMELEGRRSSGNNCSNGKQNVLKVHFSEESKEYILTPIEAQSRLTPASKCLEKGDCRRLQVGDTVLVPSNRLEHGKSGFFEAYVRDISRHQHSSMKTCNCKLEVLRVGAKNEESCNVSASEVHLVDLSTSTTQGPHRLDTSDAESDIQSQLDEQINKITMLTDSLIETSPSTMQFLADVAMKTRRTRRKTSQSSSYVEHGRRLRKDSSNITSKSRLSLDKQPRLSPLAARAALAATALTKPLRQVKPPSSPEPKVLGSHASKHRSGTRPVRAAARNASRKWRKD